MLHQERRISYRALKREFDLDDAALDDLRFELINVRGVAADQDGELLMWAGDAGQEQPTGLRPAELAPRPPLAARTRQAEQRAEPPPLPDEVAAPTPTDTASPITPSDAERRPLTVMFCDLADSTALSTRLDPEDLQDVIRAYQERCTAIVREYEGFVAKYMGDGILVYFG